MVARSAHQVFGAWDSRRSIRCTESPRRLWSWRDEAGRSEEWQRDLGGTALAVGAGSLWPLLSGTLTAGAAASGAVTTAD
jgi:hypothetical protein